MASIRSVESSPDLENQACAKPTAWLTPTSRSAVRSSRRDLFAGALAALRESPGECLVGTHRQVQREPDIQSLCRPGIRWSCRRRTRFVVLDDQGPDTHISKPVGRGRVGSPTLRTSADLADATWFVSVSSVPPRHLGLECHVLTRARMICYGCGHER
jgi:hypothetical protein